MTEKQFQAIMNRNQCPAEHINNTEGMTPVDCQRCDYDCRKCVEDFIHEVEQEPDSRD